MSGRNQLAGILDRRLAALRRCDRDGGGDEDGILFVISGIARAAVRNPALGEEEFAHGVGGGGRGGLGGIHGGGIADIDGLGAGRNGKLAEFNVALILQHDGDVAGRTIWHHGKVEDESAAREARAG